MTDHAANGEEDVSPGVVRLAQEIRRRRKNADMSQAQLAIAAGYTRQYVSNAERPGKGLPSADLVDAIDRELHAAGELSALREQAHQERLKLRSSTGRVRTESGPLTMLVPVDEDEGFDGATIDLGPRLVALQDPLHIDDEDLGRLSRLGGNVVELDLAISIDIAKDGWAKVTYRHKLLNLSGGPFTRMARELWFEHTSGRLAIEPIEEGDHRVAVQRVHDTAHLAKFACQISPAVRPGEWAMIGYSCDGGQFVDRHYWREAVRRYTRDFSIHLRHREGRRVASCSATEELADGSEKTATEDLRWDYDGDDVVITLAREFLRPNQFVELRWKVSNEST